MTMYSPTYLYYFDTQVCPYQAIYMACQILLHQCVTITTKDRCIAIWAFFGHPWYRLFLFFFFLESTLFSAIATEITNYQD
jgi:hypothetical protein